MPKRKHGGGLKPAPVRAMVAFSEGDLIFQENALAAIQLQDATLAFPSCAVCGQLLCSLEDALTLAGNETPVDGVLAQSLWPVWKNINGVLAADHPHIKGPRLSVPIADGDGTTLADGDGATANTVSAKRPRKIATNTPRMRCSRCGVDTSARSTGINKLLSLDRFSNWTVVNVGHGEVPVSC